MATHANRHGDDGGVEFVQEDDGSITARDLETGVASFGDTKAEALSMLADALALHSGDAGTPVDDEDAFLEEIGIDPDDVPDEPKPLPDFMQ